MSLSKGKWIKKKRSKLGLTQEQLAVLLHCKPNTVSLWERDATQPSLFGAIQAALHWYEYQQTRKVIAKTQSEILEQVPRDIFDEDES